MRRSPRLIGTVALLVSTLVVCAVLAYQAWDAARSGRRTADNALNDYAKVADWQLTQQTKNALLTQVVASLVSPATRVSSSARKRPYSLSFRPIRMARWRRATLCSLLPVKYCMAAPKVSCSSARTST